MQAWCECAARQYFLKQEQIYQCQDYSNCIFLVRLQVVAVAACYVCRFVAANFDFALILLQIWQSLCSSLPRLLMVFSHTLVFWAQVVLAIENLTFHKMESTFHTFHTFCHFFGIFRLRSGAKRKWWRRCERYKHWHGQVACSCSSQTKPRAQGAAMRNHAMMFVGAFTVKGGTAVEPCGRLQLNQIWINWIKTSLIWGEQVAQTNTFPYQLFCRV